MLKEITELQNKAVRELLAVTDLEDNITFKAPTGSGKTYMMADYMDRVLNKDPNIVFIVSSLSKSNLAEQNYEKFKEYLSQGKFVNIRPYLISTEYSREEAVFIPATYNVYALPLGLYKKAGKIMGGPMENFLREITKIQGKKVYLIKDESHIKTSNLDNILDKYFTKTINFSATPNLKRNQIPNVVMEENEAVAARLIKSVVYEDENDTLSDALDKFLEMKKQYLKTEIHPCFIIQISNAKEADRELKEIIYPTLNSSKFKDLKWMLIVNDEKKNNTNDRIKIANLPVSKWKDYAKENTSTIDIIIFKMVITEGWDIPRACMLYQIRDAKSEQLDEQVIGRVRRNPCLQTFEKLDEDTQTFIMKAHVWGIAQKDNGIIPVKIKENFKDTLKVMTTRLRRINEESVGDVKGLINSKKDSLSYGSIFDLYEKFSKLDTETIQTCYENIESFSEWFKYAYNATDVQNEYKKHICNYEESMELTKDNSGKIKLVSFPVFSNYNETPSKISVDNWIWQRTDDSNKFSFDSEAERDFAEILKDNILKTGKDFVWGKNFLPNSEIRFEYYWNGVHSSYPDFILKDSLGQIHIFEVKSVNKSSSIDIDKEEYEEKIRMLKECYKQAAKLTGYCFYIPIQNGGTWDITKIEKDKVTENLTIDDVIKSIT